MACPKCERYDRAFATIFGITCILILVSVAYGIAMFMQYCVDSVEVSPVSYNSILSTKEKLKSPKYDGVLANALKDGKISRGEYNTLWNIEQELEYGTSKTKLIETAK